MENESEIVILENPNESELSAIMDFHNKNFAESQWSAAYMSAFFGVSEKNSIGAVVRKDGNIVGLVLGSPDAYHHEKMILRSIAVDEKVRGAGIGKKLLDFFIKESFSRSIIKEILLSFRESKKLENFYASLGFIENGVAGKYSNGEKKVSMFLKK